VGGGGGSINRDADEYAPTSGAQVSAGAAAADIVAAAGADAAANWG